MDEFDLFGELEKLRRGHFEGCDIWCCCTKLQDPRDGKCNCGADEYNAILDEIIAYLKGIAYQ